ncbi:MAG TPA: hypothetical protein VKZ53_15240 [Candidatus Angelobacter sp.]|nr:hypothetical protein [Candidatus Angelobacter sp.]
METSSQVTQLTDGSVCDLIGCSLLEGLNRLQIAEAGFLESSAQLQSQNSNGSAPAGGRKKPAFFNLEIYSNVIQASLFLFATSIFDVFLSDTTRLLLAREIGALGKSYVVPMEVLASPKASAEIISKEIERKVRSLSHQSFLERLYFLSTVFSVHIGLSEREQGDLEDISNLKSRIVYDRPLFAFELDDEGRRRMQVKADETLPVPVTSRDLSKAKRVYLILGMRTYQAVRRDVLKLGESAEYASNLEQGLALLKLWAADILGPADGGPGEEEASSGKRPIA